LITGIAYWFDPERRVGPQSLRPNDRVRFTPSDEPGGARAVHVRVA
jgi:cold shock CspA family protein